MFDKLPHALIGVCSVLPMQGNVIRVAGDQVDAVFSLADYQSVGQGVANILSPSSSQSATTLMTG